jgi:NTP pyrophosphatase (non-canonical NTP hydrolase)
VANADNLRDASPWEPMSRPVDLKHLGKLVEELGECVAAVARCLIQGIDEAEPVTGKINREWFTDEIADVLANIELNIDHFELCAPTIGRRVERKKAHLRQWHGLLKPGLLEALRDIYALPRWHAWTPEHRELERLGLVRVIRTGTLATAGLVVFDVTLAGALHAKGLPLS